MLPDVGDLQNAIAFSDSAGTRTRTARYLHDIPVIFSYSQSSSSQRDLGQLPPILRLLNDITQRWKVAEHCFLLEGQTAARLGRKTHHHVI